MSPKAISEAVSRLAKKAGIEDITTHAFRRMTGTELSAAGVDAAAAAGRMGHTVQVMYDRYVKPTNDRSAAAAGLLSDRYKQRGLPIGELPRALMQQE